MTPFVPPSMPIAQNAAIKAGAAPLPPAPMGHAKPLAPVSSTPQLPQLPPVQFPTPANPGAGLPAPAMPAPTAPVPNFVPQEDGSFKIVWPSPTGTTEGIVSGIVPKPKLPAALQPPAPQQ